MAISIELYDKDRNYIVIDTQKTRLRKLQTTINHFFDDCKAAGLYAQSLRDKGRYYPVLITLTYQTNADWDKRDISKVVDAYRKDWKQRLKQPPEHFRYVWVAEQQKRGTIHYHLVLFCPRGKSLAKPDKYHLKGQTKIEGVRKGIKSYLSKYLSKGTVGFQGGEAEHMPKGARLFGHGGMSGAARAHLSYELLPTYVKGWFEEGKGAVRRIKGGWKQAKFEIVSPWEVFRGEVNGEYRIIINWNPAYSMLEGTC